MRFSIIIPTYKRLYLEESVRSVVEQSYQYWELVVVDDCSPEQLETVITPYLSDNRIHYYKNPQNIGAKNLVKNWNQCLKYCHGDYVICIGDDDRLLPNCLDELSKLIDEYPDLNVYHTQTEIIDEKGDVVERLEPRPEKESAISMIEHRWKGAKQFVGDFCYLRKHLVSSQGFFDLPYAWGSDDITAFRAALKNGIANTVKVGFQYRENQQSISLSRNDDEKVESVLLQKKWYETTFSLMREQDILPEKEIRGAEDIMNVFINRLVCHHILRDMQMHGVTAYSRWCRSRKRYGISIITLTKLFIKSLLVR